MPELASISVNDAETVPVAHVYEPSGKSGRVSNLRNNDSATPAGAETLQLEYIEPGSATAAHRIILRGKFPVEATVDGQDKVVRTSSFEVTINESQLSTLQERKNHAKIISGLLQNAVVLGMIEGPEMAW